MTEPLDDAEQLAALLDGRLDARQRAEVLARLGESEATLEAFVDAAAVLREQADTGVQRQEQTSRLRWRAPTLAVAAAVLAAAVLVPLVRSRFAQRDSDDPGRFAAILSADGVRVPADWNGTPWARARGAGEAVRPEARAARLGARLVDLDLARSANDSASASRIAADIATLLDPLPASAPVAAIYRGLASPGTAAGRDSLLDLGRPAVAELAGRDAVDLGAWTEAALLAADRRDAHFFESRAGRAMLSRASSRAPQLPQAIKSADWATTERALASLLQTLTS